MAFFGLLLVQQLVRQFCAGGQEVSEHTFLVHTMHVLPTFFYIFFSKLFSHFSICTLLSPNLINFFAQSTV